MTPTNQPDKPESGKQARDEIVERLVYIFEKRLNYHAGGSRTGTRMQRGVMPSHDVQDL